MTRRRRLGRALAGALLAAMLYALLSLPGVANHFGYATLFGLPYRVHFAGRDYWNAHVCAGGGWCGSEGPNCSPASDIIVRGYGPPHPVGAVFSIAGAPYALIEPEGLPSARYPVPTVVWLRYGDNCYLPYALMGGP